MAFYFSDPVQREHVMTFLLARQEERRNPDRIVIPPKRSLRSWLSYVYANLRVRS